MNTNKDYKGKVAVDVNVLTKYFYTSDNIVCPYGITAHKNVLVMFGKTRDQDVFRFIDNMPPLERKELLAIYKDKETMSMVWNKQIPKVYDIQDFARVLPGSDLRPPLFVQLDPQDDNSMYLLAESVLYKWLVIETAMEKDFRTLVKT